MLIESPSPRSYIHVLCLFMYLSKFSWETGALYTCFQSCRVATVRPDFKVLPNVLFTCIQKELILLFP